MDNSMKMSTWCLIIQLWFLIKLTIPSLLDSASETKQPAQAVVIAPSKTLQMQISSNPESE